MNRATRTLCEEIASNLCVNEHWEHDQPIFFVTLILKKEGLVTTETNGIDLGSMRRGLRVDLRGLSYLGAFEPAYASLPVSEHVWAGRPSVGIPCAALGVSAEQTAQLIRKLRKSGKYQAVVEELKPVHAEQVANSELPELVAYLVKPPTHAYRVQHGWAGMAKYGSGRMERRGSTCSSSALSCRRVNGCVLFTRWNISN